MVVPVCFKTPLLCLLTQKTAQKFGYVLGIGDIGMNRNTPNVVKTLLRMNVHSTNQCYKKQDILHCRVIFRLKQVLLLPILASLILTEY